MTAAMPGNGASSMAARYCARYGARRAMRASRKRSWSNRSVSGAWFCRQNMKVLPTKCWCGRSRYASGRFRPHTGQWRVAWWCGKVRPAGDGCISRVIARIRAGPGKVRSRFPSGPLENKAPGGIFSPGGLGRPGGGIVRPGRAVAGLRPDRRRGSPSRNCSRRRPRP